MKRILPPVFLLLCVVAMSLSQMLFPVTRIVPWPYGLAGLLPLIIGIAMAISGKRQFTKEGTNIYTFNDPDKMITTGLFTYSRNPMYLGFAIVAFSAAIVMGGAVPLCIALIHFTVLDRYYINFEEGRMSERFGDSYDDYKRRVRRWL